MHYACQVTSEKAYPVAFSVLLIVSSYIETESPNLPCYSHALPIPSSAKNLLSYSQNKFEAIRLKLNLVATLPTTRLV